MYIKYLKMENYRSFENVELWFDKEANYLVGENDIGKSNFLDLLAIMSSGHGIVETDFRNVTKAIIITMELCFLENNHEHFVDARIKMLCGRVRMEQTVEEIYPRLYMDKTNELLPLDTIRLIRYISHTAGQPEETFISSQIYRRLEEQLSQCDGKEGIADEKTMELIKERERFGDFDSAYYSNVQHLFRLLHRTEHSMADSMKFISTVAMKIITQVFVMYYSHAIPFQQALIEDADGKRYLPLIISIDEPEVHLHPYMQRSVMAYYQEVLNNKDKEFCQLLKTLFGIDGLRGQLFIVTHSTDALVDDYRNIIRFYRDESDAVRAACGSTFNFGEEIEKHLIMHFPEVKESLYSRSVIIVEGETEYGCFRLFGNTLGCRFDYHGICLINARGESSIARIKTLLERFKIPTVALYDADVKADHLRDSTVFFTDEICFEMDLVTAVMNRHKRELLDQIIMQASGGSTKVNNDMIQKATHKLDLNYHLYPPRRLQNISSRQMNDLIVYYFAWLYSNKGVILGRIMGQHLGPEDIPSAFVTVIRKAVALSK